MTPPGYDANREMLLIDVIDHCPACNRLQPLVCPPHRGMAVALATQRHDAAHH